VRTETKRPDGRQSVHSDDHEPEGGFARFVPELHVQDLESSLAFWRDACGFQVAYRRTEECFVFLERAGAQLMLCQRRGRYETGALAQPLGRGAMFQIYVDSVEPILSVLTALNWPLYEQLSDRWYQVGDREKGLRQFLFRIQTDI
jgi:catechol 2,3-dioxygenase-like lactoylglutathione lyase family enzyme